MSSISKDEAEMALGEAGYIAKIANGVLMVTGVTSNRQASELKKLIREIGYHASWGYIRETGEEEEDGHQEQEGDPSDFREGLRG